MLSAPPHGDIPAARGDRGRGRQVLGAQGDIPAARGDPFRKVLVTSRNISKSGRTIKIDYLPQGGESRPVRPMFSLARPVYAAPEGGADSWQGRWPRSIPRATVRATEQGFARHARRQLDRSRPPEIPRVQAPLRRRAGSPRSGAACPKARAARISRKEFRDLLDHVGDNRSATEFFHHLLTDEALKGLLSPAVEVAPQRPKSGGDR